MNEYSFHNDKDDIHPTIFSEAGKAFMRGRIISYVAAHKKEVHDRFKLASKTLRTAQLEYQQNPNTTTQQNWQAATLQFNLSQDLIENLYNDQCEGLTH